MQATITGDTFENVFKLPRHAGRHGNEVALATRKWWSFHRLFLERHDIKILWRDEEWVITRSLQPGDVLITTPIDYATNDQALQVRIEGEASPGPLNGKPKGKKDKRGKGGKGKPKRK